MAETTKPQPSTLEQSIIGAILLDPAAVFEIKDQLQPDHFADGRLKRYYAEALKLAGEGIEVDIATLGAAFKTKADKENLAALIHVVPTAAHVKGYAIKALAEHQKRVQNAAGDPAEAVEKITEAQRLIDNLQGRLLPDKRYSVADMQADFKRHRGLAFGYDGLDKLASIGSGGITLIAGRPGAGKTAMLVNLALRLAKAENEVAYFTYEEPAAFILAKLAMIEAGEAGILDKAQNFNLLRRWLRTDREKAGMINHRYDRPLKALTAALETLDGLQNLRIYDQGLPVEQLCRQITQIAESKPEAVIVVDYVQKIPPAKPRPTRQIEIQDISRQLLQAAIQTGLPIICGAQLNRDESQPTLSRLREAGDLEQDAALIIGLKKQAEGDKLLAEIAKNRYGRTAGDIELGFSGSNFAIE